MTTIKDDCFNVADGLMELSDALALIKSRTNNVCGVEEIQLRDSLGRTLAEDIKSSVNVPPHNNSAMDGYAVFSSDLNAKEPTRLPVTGRIAAGHPLERDGTPGEALRIFTGAPLPPGPDTVVMQENVTVDGDFAVFPAGAKPGDNCRKMGEDIKSGNIILHQGQLLRAQEIGLGAAVGKTTAKVYKRLRAGVFSTGDEIVDASTKSLKPGFVYDANRASVIALLESLGCHVTDLGI
ncbi:MAG: molybdopterin molybdotransferase MoeA, partial [Rhodospirillaceae bacterium]|nr:molybdopterin molybdotransferase MoeA [Rhodospirillaceae bacterium]